MAHGRCKGDYGEHLPPKEGKGGDRGGTGVKEGNKGK